MKTSEKKISAKSWLTELTKFKSHQTYLDRDIGKIDILVHAAELNKLKMEQEINLPLYMQNVQHETQDLMHMVADFKNRMINVAGLFNNNTKRYREEIQLIDHQLRKIESKNLAELKELKLEYYQIEESAGSMCGIVFGRNRSLSRFELARSSTNLAGKRQVMSAPINRSFDGTTHQ